MQNHRMSTQTPGLVPTIPDWGRLLDGKVAIVTGGGDGIGGAISRLFAQHGALVEIAEIDPERAERARSEIESSGGTVRAHVVDVTDPAACNPFVADVLSTHGRVDILINNVGDYRPQARFQDSTPESWEAMYSINLLHIFAMTRAVIQSMMAARSGAIVNFHSVEGMRGYPGDPVYAAFKGAAAHFTTSLAVTMGRYGIRVNGIGPDLTQTPQVDYITNSEGHEDLWPSWAPVGRLGWPEDQARVALFLASDMSGYVTGHNVPVDGGTKAGGGWFYSPTARRFMNRPTTL
jgi:NAD(P)-dependent dehydrogenase (short-subunit alcohol dehydrogenase family)